MDFNKACPSGNIMQELSNGESKIYGEICEDCYCANDEHKCRECRQNIDHRECWRNGGFCDECLDCLTGK